MQDRFRSYIYNNEELFIQFLKNNHSYDSKVFLWENVVKYLKDTKKEVNADSLMEIYDNKYTNEIYNISLEGKLVYVPYMLECRAISHEIKYIPKNFESRYKVSDLNYTTFGTDNNEEIEKVVLRGRYEHNELPGSYSSSDVIKAKGLFLDDIRTPVQNKVYQYTFSTHIDDIYNVEIVWDIARTYEEFLTFILNGNSYDFISLDHDLTVEAMENFYKTSGYIDYSHKTKTGNDVALFITKNIEMFKHTNIRIHSNNPKGRENMIDVLNDKLNVIESNPEWEYTDDYINMPNYKEYLNIKKRFKK